MLARAADTDQAAAAKAHRAARGHTPQRGLAGRQTSAARSRTAQFHSLDASRGVALATSSHSDRSDVAGRSDGRPRYRRYTRALTPSTTGARFPKPTTRVALAAYRPTPGRASRASRSPGNASETRDLLRHRTERSGPSHQPEGTNHRRDRALTRPAEGCRVRPSTEQLVIDLRDGLPTGALQARPLQRARARGRPSHAKGRSVDAPDPTPGAAFGTSGHPRTRGYG